MCKVTPDTLTWFALPVPDEPGGAVEDDEDDEQAVSTARLAAAARASTRFVRFITVLP
jgi:hypothetical protein